jgi:hypothetical protein
MILTGENRRSRRKTCPIAPLFATNPTRTDPGAIQGLRSDRLATGRLSHGTAFSGNYRPNGGSGLDLYMLYRCQPGQERGKQQKSATEPGIVPGLQRVVEYHLCSLRDQ